MAAMKARLLMMTLCANGIKNDFLSALFKKASLLESFLELRGRFDMLFSSGAKSS